MYNVIRKIHLFTGLGLLVFVIMYFASGWVMIHERTFPRGKPAETTRTETLYYSGDRAPEVVAEYLRRQFHLPGKKQAPVKQADGSWRFRFNAPALSSEATVSPGFDKVQIKEMKLGVAGLAHGYHRLHGYDDTGFFDLWAVVYDLASASLILFAFTGIYMWFSLTKQRWPGWICLAISFSLAIAAVLHFANAR